MSSKISSTRQEREIGSSDIGGDKANKTIKTRRKWSHREEEVLIAALKELVAQEWKSDNGFRAGYLNKLEDAMKKEFPSTDLKATPNINSKIQNWKKDYYSLMQILSLSGVGFNQGTHMIDCDNDQWEQIIKSDGNARLMRNKQWHFLDDWKECFGKDRATGERAEDILEALNELSPTGDNVAEDGTTGDYQFSPKDIFENDVVETSVCQSQKGDKLKQATKQSGKKRKSDDGLEKVCELLGEISRNTNARLEKLASRIGYEQDLSKARKEVFELLSNIPRLSLEDKFYVCEHLAAKVECLDIFMGLPDYARPQYVMHLLSSKGL